MRGAIPFRFNRSGIMLALVSAAFAHEAGAAAGRTEFVIGGVTVARDGVERPLARGTELDNGDTVRTNNGRAQIRFTDGAYVSLQPNTEYSIRNYRYDGPGGAEESGFFGLLKGAMRTVTGAIGRLNRDAYRIATPTATVGIRGTGGVIEVQDDGSTRVIGTSGIWSLTNPSGSVDVPAGTSAVAPSDPNRPPQETTQQPTSGPAPVPQEQPVFVAGDQVDEQGLPVLPFTPLKTGPGYGAAFAYSGQSEGFFADIDGGEFSFFASDAVFDGQGRLTSISDPVFDGDFQSYTLTNGQHADFGSDGILAWGRWTGEVTFDGGEGGSFTEPYNENQGFHYVVGMPTPVMPTVGEATYSLIGATRPTYASGATAPGTVTSGTLSVQFSPGSFVVSLINFGVQMPDASYRLDGNRTMTDGGPGWSLSPTVTPISGPGTCMSGCSADVTGFFAGANAIRSGMTYSISDGRIDPETGGLSFHDVVGAAAFKKN